MEELKKIANNDPCKFVGVWNEYVFENEDYSNTIYYMEHFSENVAGVEPLDLALKIFNGSSIYPGSANCEEFNPNNNFYFFNGYENLVSFSKVYNSFSNEFLDFIDERALLDYINEHEVEF